MVMANGVNTCVNRHFVIFGSSVGNRLLHRPDTGRKVFTRTKKSSVDPQGHPERNMDVRAKQKKQFIPLLSRDISRATAKARGSVWKTMKFKHKMFKSNTLTVLGLLLSHAVTCNITATTIPTALLRTSTATSKSGTENSLSTQTAPSTTFATPTDYSNTSLLIDSTGATLFTSNKASTAVVLTSASGSTASSETTASEPQPTTDGSRVPTTDGNASSSTINVYTTNAPSTSHGTSTAPMHTSNTTGTSPETITGISTSTSSETTISNSISTSPETTTGISTSTSSETTISNSISTSPETTTGISTSTSSETTISNSISTSPETTTGISTSTSSETTISNSISTSPETTTGISTSTSSETTISNSISTSTSTTTTSTTTTIQTTTMDQEGHKSEALSSGAIAAIVCLFIVMVVVVLGGLYYYKIRRTSYGPLLDRDYGTLGNFSNPMYNP
ncbi:hypothetical protein F2P81_015798 [Scophthalmus maximus]|uniref:Prostate androgen-regulated mucin-like protein 1 n=1 Tax=Scophthalmus maximus TaxID=52904 RepID=A0A6A4SAH9_SCOMX|nr:hypothetical protein F2P81_015798 [Scophthalmus maximus]